MVNHASRKFLFIGGLWDGRRVEVGVQYDFMEVMAEPIHEAAVDNNNVPNPITNVYVKRTIASRDMQLQVYVLQEIGQGEMMQRLIDGYKA